MAQVSRAMTRDDVLRRLADHLPELRALGVGSLSLFGSVLKGTARPDSDVDLLVEFEPGATPGLLALCAMSDELSALLGGRRVDLRTPQDLSRHFRDEVLRTAETQYARG